MPIIKKTKTAKKVVKKTKKTVSRTPIKASTKKTKNPVAYFQCMSTCCQKGISPKKITQVAHECKTNALAINTKMSAQKKQDIKKLAASFDQFRKTLGEHVKKY